MNFDGVLLGALVTEINPLLIDGRVRKIARPSGNHLVFTIETRESRFLFDACVEPGRSCLILTSAATRELSEAFAVPRNRGDDGFVMLLVKHVKGARITGVSQMVWDKVVRISTEKRDEAGTVHSCCLYIELTGRNPNAVLVDRSSDRVLGAMRSHSLGCPQNRPTIPGTLYRPPFPVGASPDDLSVETFVDAVLKASGISDGWKALQGVSSGLWREVLDFASEFSIDSAIVPNSIDHLTKVAMMARSYLIALHSGNIPRGPHGNLFSNFIFRPEDEGPLYERHAFAWLAEQAENARAERIRKASRAIARARARLALRLSKMEKELSECSMAADYRRSGDLIMASLRTISKGDPVARVPDHYNGGMAEIPLDPRFLPIDNAQRYYRRARKMDSRTRHLGTILSEVRQAIFFLDETAFSLSMAGTGNSVLDDALGTVMEAIRTRGGDRTVFQVLGRGELAEILKEMGVSHENAGRFGHDSGKERKGGSGKGRAASTKVRESEGTIAIRRIMPFDGVEVFIGTSAVQNDFLVSRIAGREDLWFHARGVTGGHVIARPVGRGAISEEEDLYRDIVSCCAGIAAWFSSVASSGRVEVQFTRRKFLRKVKGLFPGTVLVDREETLSVDPAEPVPGSMEFVRFTLRRPSVSESRGDKRRFPLRPSK